MLVRSLGWEDSPGGGHGNPLQCSCLETAMDRGSLQAIVVLQRVEHDWSDLACMHAHGIFYLFIYFEKSPYSFPQWLYSFTFLQMLYKGSLFSTSSPTFIIWWQPFWQVCSDISSWFWFAFSWWLMMLSIFSCACWPPAYSLWKKKSQFSSSVHS